MRWWVEHEKRNSISTSNHAYFVYHINTIALYSQEAPTSLMNENKWIDNSQITIMECVGANYNSSNGKMRRITITKTTMFVIFNLQNSHEWKWSSQWCAGHDSGSK